MYTPSCTRRSLDLQMLVELTSLLLVYRYWAILPFALFEAPLMSIVIGFFVVTGHLSLLPAFGIVVAGDMIGDTVLYLFGRWGRPLFSRANMRLGQSGPKTNYIAAQYVQHSYRAVVISKLVHGVG